MAPIDIILATALAFARQRANRAARFGRLVQVGSVPDDSVFVHEPARRAAIC